MSTHTKGSDALTGLPVREGFDELLRDAVDDPAAATPVSLALYDIDRFLALNEASGREAGDAVLRAVAAVFQERLPSDAAAVCRLGGDEFAVIMPGTEKEQAFLALEQARAAVGSLDEFAGMDPAPSVSVGIASYPDDAGTRQELLRKADDALYRAKCTGRNKVVLAREEKKVPKTSHYTQGQLERLTALSEKEGVGEAELLREALDDLLKKYSS